MHKLNCFQLHCLLIRINCLTSLILKSRAILKHRPSRLRPRASHLRGPPTFEDVIYLDHIWHNLKTNIITEVACGWPLFCKAYASIV